jgi:hypothetical protein
MNGMFVLLEHHAAAEGSRHWDLLVEMPGADALATWRLERSPLDADHEIPATRIQDHRRLYLDYEGEISGGRGAVRRLDRGAATIESAGDRVLLVLSGECLRGRFEITPAGTGQLVFKAVAQ